MPDPRTQEARLWQMTIAGVFLGLGAWCVVEPDFIIDLTVLSEHRAQSLLASVTIGAFGAQAMLVGLLGATAQFTRGTYLALGLAILPFFVFDWWFYAVEPLFNEFILLDVAGNLLMLGACFRGWWLLRGAAAER